MTGNVEMGGGKNPRAQAIGLAWLGLAWLGLAWLGLAWLGLAWLGLAWLGLAWLGNTIPVSLGDVRFLFLVYTIVKRCIASVWMLVAWVQQDVAAVQTHHAGHAYPTDGQAMGTKA